MCFHGLLMTIAASMVVVRTDRGDDMFMTWLARNAQQALDLDAVELLPEPRSGGCRAAAPRAEADEGRHEPGPEALWNESWYFDAVSDDGALGVYVRLGRLPNQGIVPLHGLHLRPGPALDHARRRRPRRCPTPRTTPRRSRPPALHAEQDCLEPLSASG